MMQIMVDLTERQRSVRVDPITVGEESQLQERIPMGQLLGDCALHYLLIKGRT